MKFHYHAIDSFAELGDHEGCLEIPIPLHGGDDSLVIHMGEETRTQLIDLLHDEAAKWQETKSN